MICTEKGVANVRKLVIYIHKKRSVYVAASEGLEVPARREDVRALIHRLERDAARHPRAWRSTAHYQISVRPQDGEKLTLETWAAVVREYMQQMGHAHTNWVARMHTDTDNPHVHIVACRALLTDCLQTEARKGAAAASSAGTQYAGAGPTGHRPRDGNLVRTWRNGIRSILFANAMEERLGLSRTSRPGQSPNRRGTRADFESRRRSGEHTVRVQLQDAVAEAIKDRPTLAVLQRRLGASGISVRANTARTGRVSGLAFGLKGWVFRGSRLGKEFGWARLSQNVTLPLPDRQVAVAAPAKPAETRAGARPDRRGAPGAGMEALAPAGRGRQR